MQTRATNDNEATIVSTSRAGDSIEILPDSTYDLQPLAVDELLNDLPSPLELPEDFVDALDYARRIELYVPQYRAEVSVRRARETKEIADFLAGWEIEEVAHGKILSAIVVAADPRRPDAVGAAHADVGRMADQHRRTTRRNHCVAALLPGPFEAAHMTFGLLNEWLTLIVYLMLAERTDDRVVRRALRAVAKQESKHAAFYRRYAERELTRSRRSRLLVRSYLQAGRWAPAGGSIHSDQETAELLRYLASGEELGHHAERIDRRVQTLPGMNGLEPTKQFLARLLP